MPRDLNIPIKRRNLTSFWFILACVALSIFTVKPLSLPSWIVTILLVAPAFWFAFAGPGFLNRLALNNRYIFASWLVFTIKLIVFFLVLNFLAPYATSIVSGWFHA